MRILDYKTADRAAQPDKTHYHKEKGWIDLQLPLYQDLSKSALPKLNGRDRAWLFNLPKKLMKPALPRRRGTPRLCWMPEMSPKTSFASCLRITRILSSQSPPPAKYSEDFAAICLDDQSAGRPLMTKKKEAKRERHFLRTPDDPRLGRSGKTTG